MNTADPATRPTFSFLELTNHSFNMLPSRLILLDGDNPTNPLIARERRNALPCCQRRSIGNERLP